eukprot:scaffold341328_cov90-Attheya_sp.AAC.1
MLGTNHGPAQFANFSDEQRRAVRSNARDAEQAALDVAKLSIQELIDCDTNYDEGCRLREEIPYWHFTSFTGTDSRQTKNIRI